MTEERATYNGELPQYQCHKKVRALKIVEIRSIQLLSNPPINAWELLPEDKSYGPIQVHEPFFAKHQPMAPGYYVVYEDGYTSWSPVEAFESGYRRI